MPEHAWAHAGITGSEPPAGATLGASPADVRLTFSEQPEVSLSEVRVLDKNGAEQQSGRPHQVSGDPLSLSVPVRALPRGVYTVSWTVVSAVDGHGTDGTFAFGVRASPHGAGVTTGSTTPNTSWLELVARWILLVGLVALIGGAVAAVGRFGGSAGSDLRLAAAGWVTSVIGLLLLAEAQRSTASTSFNELFDTAVGRALIWRGVSVAIAGGALLVAWWAPRIRRGALLGAALAALAAIVFHVAAGHAAAGPWPSGVTVTAQAVHFAAAGVWFGGLAALLLGVRGKPSAEKAAAVRRFAIVALAALILVVATGTLRAIDELAAPGQLVTNGYGRAVLAKIILIGLIFGLAARNRRRGVAAAESDLAPLRRTSKAELGLALAALAFAAVLGAIAPPVSSSSGGLPGLSASGSDFGTTVRVSLAAASDQPGPNRFVAQVEDYDSGQPVKARRVSLRFTALDDPGVEPSTLSLKRAPDGSYVGSGPNLAFAGPWGVSALIERGGNAVEVPLRLDLRIPIQSLSIVRQPGRPVEYTMQIGSTGYIRVSPDPGRAGPNKVLVSCFGGPFEDLLPIDQLVLAAQSPGLASRQQPVTRLGKGRFVADAELAPGPNTITVVARTTYGTRLAGQLHLRAPRR